MKKADEIENVENVEPKSIYISGPMTGYIELNCPAFNKAEEFIKDKFPKAKITNPAKLRHYKNWKRCLVRDVEKMFERDIDTIILLPGWKSSRGANIEVFLAKKLFQATILKIVFDYKGNATLHEIGDLDFSIVHVTK